MAEEKKNRSEELESLDKKINEIINGWNQNPEEIVEFLQFSSKFSYAYSPRNMMLIAQQQRGALRRDFSLFEVCKQKWKARS